MSIKKKQPPPIPRVRPPSRSDAHSQIFTPVVVVREGWPPTCPLAIGTTASVTTAWSHSRSSNADMVVDGVNGVFSAITAQELAHHFAPMGRNDLPPVRIGGCFIAAETFEAVHLDSGRTVTIPVRATGVVFCAPDDVGGEPRSGNVGYMTRAGTLSGPLAVDATTWLRALRSFA